MDNNRKANGQFGKGNRANPHGRPRKDRSARSEVTRELNAPITIIENGKRKKVTKLAANTKQIINKGAAGDIKAAKLTVDYALRADMAPEAALPCPELSQSDKEIVARFISRLRATELKPELLRTSDQAQRLDQSALQKASAIQLENPDADAQP